MKPTFVPNYRSLERREIDAVLARNNVGRIAYVRADRIDIEPVHYVYANGWLYGRTSPDRKPDPTGTGWWPVAFEVDEITDALRWRSVVVHGGFYTLDPNGAAWERDEAAKVITLLREIPGEAFIGEAPTPRQNILFRIGAQEVTGRDASPAPAGTTTAIVAPY